MTDRMFRHGRNYHECPLRCLELRGDEETFLFPPALVLLAFVVEIYFEGLLAVEGKTGKDLHAHDHRALYGRLTAETQRSEEHTSALQSLMRISYAVLCLKKENN